MTNKGNTTKLTIKELKEMLKLHELWLQNNKKGEKLNLSYKDLRKPSIIKLLKTTNLSYADLSYTNLNGTNLSYTNLSSANLSNANLNNIDLSNANLSFADLSWANLRHANLNDTDLSYVNLNNANLFKASLCYATLLESCLKYAQLIESNLSNAYLSDANLHYINLSQANLSNVNLNHANLYNANLKGAYNVPYIRLACPDTGSFIGWKKVRNYIIKLRIPSKAKRYSAASNKCRCEYAKVLEIQNLDGSKANINEITNYSVTECTYRVGEIVYPDEFDSNRWNECSNGIHFFINRQEAVDY